MKMLSPYEHELNSEGTGCATDCPACEWAGTLRECVSDCPACAILSYWCTGTKVTITDFDRDFLKTCNIVPELTPIN